MARTVPIGSALTDSIEKSILLKKLLADVSRGYASLHFNRQGINNCAYSVVDWKNYQILIWCFHTFVPFCTMLLDIQKTGS